ncbi:MAG: hypothetical protein ACLFQV_05695 [Vulcanimicrobiota bacterium]
MLLEVKVFGSEEWFEQVHPRMLLLGFREDEDLMKVDPESDGEVTIHYFDLKKKGAMTFEEFTTTIKDMEEIIMEGEAPFIEFRMVPDK